MSVKKIDQILEKWTDPSKRVFNGVTFIAIDKQGEHGICRTTPFPDISCIDRETKCSTGNTLYKGSAGKLRFDPEDNAVVQPDSLCWIASMTKVVTAVAIMQLVERGLLDVEQDVREIVPELKDLQILVGFERPTEATQVAEGEVPQSVGKPIMEPIKGKLTIR